MKDIPYILRSLNSNQWNEVKIYSSMVFVPKRDQMAKKSVSGAWVTTVRNTRTKKDRQFSAQGAKNSESALHAYSLLQLLPVVGPDAPTK